MRAGALALVAALLLGGCGYTVRGTLPAHINTVAVPPNADSHSTHRAGAEIEPGATEAPVIAWYAFDKDANVRLYRLVVTVNLKMRDIKRNTVLFQQNQVQEQADFRVQGQVSQTISREETALRTAATDIGRAIVALAVTRF